MLAMLQKANTKLSPTPIESSQQGWNLHWGFHAKPLYEDNMIKTLYAYIYIYIKPKIFDGWILMKLYFTYIYNL